MGLNELIIQRNEELTGQLAAKTEEVDRLIVGCGSLLLVLRDVWLHWANTDLDGVRSAGESLTLQRVQEALTKGRIIGPDGKEIVYPIEH